MINRIYSMLGLARKAGKLVAGADVCSESIIKGESFLVIIANDASEKSKKRFINECTNYNVDYRMYGDNETISHSIGRDNKIVISICDKSFGNSIRTMIDKELNGGEFIGEN